MSRYSIVVNGRSYAVELLGRTGSTLSFAIEGTSYTVEVSTTPVADQALGTKRVSGPQHTGALEIRAPIPGIISEVRVAPGDSISEDATLVVIEAMKMENPIKAARAGTVTKVHVQKGQEVPSGHPLVEIE
jgi:biotin carboxyl carrier protein